MNKLKKQKEGKNWYKEVVCIFKPLLVAFISISSIAWLCYAKDFGVIPLAVFVGWFFIDITRDVKQ